MNQVINATFFAPENATKKYNGKVILSDSKTFIEIIDYGKQREIGMIPSYDILYAQDNKTGYKYSFLNLFISTWNGKKLTFTVNEIYEGGWVEKVNEKLYNQCETQMSGLAVWINERLFDFGFKENTHIINAEIEKEKVFNLNNGLNIIFKKFIASEYNETSINIQEKASLVIETENKESRHYFNLIIKSISYLISLSYYKQIHIWEINYNIDGVKEPITFKNEPIGNEEILTKVNMLLSINDIIDESVLNKLFLNTEKINEINMLLVASLDNIVVENKFLYCVKAIELIFKNLYFVDNCATVKEYIKDFGIKDSAWVEKINPKKEISNFKLMLFHLWQKFDCKELSIQDNENAYHFLSKVHSSRNYYTHLTLDGTIFLESELYSVSNVLRTMCFGLVMQHLEIKRGVIMKFVSNNSRFLDINQYSKNEYSINYSKQ